MASLLEQEENRDIYHSVFELNRLMHKALPSCSELVEINDDESMFCVKAGFEELDEPSPTYTCRDDYIIPNQPSVSFDLLNIVEKQAERSLVYLFLPDSRVRTLHIDESFRVSSRIADVAASDVNKVNELTDLIDANGCMKKYTSIIERLNKYITDTSIYHGMVLRFNEPETPYYQQKLNYMKKELGYRGIMEPLSVKTSGTEVTETVYCQGPDFVIKRVETREELINVVDCMQETFTDFKSGPLTADIMQKEYPLVSDENIWICIKQDGQVATTGQVIFGEKTCSGTNLCTKPAFRGRGYATLMMMAMVELAKTRKDKYERIVIQASTDGFPIYAKLGYHYRYDFQILELNPQASN